MQSNNQDWVEEYLDQISREENEFSPLFDYVQLSFIVFMCSVAWLCAMNLIVKYFIL
jgi:hypothetical protein